MATMGLLDASFSAVRMDNLTACQCVKVIYVCAKRLLLAYVILFEVRGS
jgi:hypothetical protein